MVYPGHSHLSPRYTFSAKRGFSAKQEVSSLFLPLKPEFHSLSGSTSEIFVFEVRFYIRALILIFTELFGGTAGRNV